MLRRFLQAQGRQRLLQGAADRQSEGEGTAEPAPSDGPSLEVRTRALPMEDVAEAHFLCRDLASQCAVCLFSTSLAALQMVALAVRALQRHLIDTMGQRYEVALLCSASLKAGYTCLTRMGGEGEVKRACAKFSSPGLAPRPPILGRHFLLPGPHPKTATAQASAQAPVSSKAPAQALARIYCIAPGRPCALGPCHFPRAQLQRGARVGMVSCVRMGGGPKVTRALRAGPLSVCFWQL